MAWLEDNSRPLACLGAGALAAHAAPSLGGVSETVAGWLGVQTRLASDAGVALTFDDGPHAEGTPAVLELLHAADAPATFVLVGEQVERMPRLVGEIAAAGHELGVHCQRHRNLLRLTPWQVRDDLRRAEAVIADAAGVRPRLYRPPYGILTGPALLLARRRGWRTALWSRWGRDWQGRATAASISRRVLDGLAPGEVVLLHDADHYSAPGSWRRTVGALPAILDQLAGARRPVRLD